MVSPTSASSSGDASLENNASGDGAVKAIDSSAVGSVTVPVTGVALAVAVFVIAVPASISA